MEDVDLDAGDDGLAGPWAEDATTLAVKERAEAAAAAKEATKAKEEEAAAAAAAAAGENGDDDEAEDGGRARASAAAAANVHVQEPDADAEKWEKVNERKMSYLLLDSFGNMPKKIHRFIPKSSSSSFLVLYSL